MTREQIQAALVEASEMLTDADVLLLNRLIEMRQADTSTPYYGTASLMYATLIRGAEERIERIERLKAAQSDLANETFMLGCELMKIAGGK